MFELAFGNGDPAAPLRQRARTALIALQGVRDETWLDDVLVAISELVQNVSQHTRGGGKLRVTLETDAVLIEVADGDPTAPAVQRPCADRPGGRGLLLIDLMAVNWGVVRRPAGKVVWARLPALLGGPATFRI